MRAGIRLHAMGRILEIHVEMQAADLDIGRQTSTARANDRARATGRRRSSTIPARDARHVQQVVDEAGLQLRVPADHLERFRVSAVRLESLCSQDTVASTGVSGVRNS